MFWRLFSAITLLEKRGPEVDQANLSRYLAESCYVPTALLPGQHVSWRAIDSDRAEATLWHAGSKAVAEFHFNEEGQITKMTATDRARCARHLACSCTCAATVRWHPAACCCCGCISLAKVCQLTVRSANLCQTLAWPRLYSISMVTACGDQPAVCEL